MAAALYSNPPLADFILSEASGQRSRDNVVVTQTGDAIESGTLLSKGAGGKYVPYTTADKGAAVGILYNRLEAATGDTKAVAFTADCEVKASALVGLNANADAGLLTVGIKLRRDGDRLGVQTPAL